MNLDKLHKFYRESLKRNGYVDMDFNMAVLCIIAKRRPDLPMKFMDAGKMSHEEKLESWAGLRRFCWLQCHSENDVLEAAQKQMEHYYESSMH